MTRQERAKQFMPFDAMKGLQEALRDREERYSRVDRHDISEEQQLRNSRVIERLNRGCKVRLECHHDFHDVCMQGRVTELSRVMKYLKIEEEKILFEDIYSLEILD